MTIKDAGEPSKPFTPLRGCDVCCGEGRCANCTKCINDKTGDCAFCHKNSQRAGGETPFILSCLGHEAKDGGPTPGLAAYTPGDTFKPAKMTFMLKGMSPGCPKCWADNGACTPRERV